MNYNFWYDHFLLHYFAISNSESYFSVRKRKATRLTRLRALLSTVNMTASHSIYVMKEVFTVGKCGSTGSSITERSKVSAFFIEKYFYFKGTFDVILFTIEVHLVFCFCFFQKEMENYEKFHFMYVINRKKWKKISKHFSKFFLFL